MKEIMIAIKAVVPVVGLMTLYFICMKANIKKMLAALGIFICVIVIAIYFLPVYVGGEDKEIAGVLTFALLALGIGSSCGHVIGFRKEANDVEFERQDTPRHGVAKLKKEGHMNGYLEIVINNKLNALVKKEKIVMVTRSDDKAYNDNEHKVKTTVLLSNGRTVGSTVEIEEWNKILRM